MAAKAPNYCRSLAQAFSLSLLLLFLVLVLPNSTYAQDTVWIEDALPAGASTNGDESWNWVSANPSPFSGTSAHQSSIAAGTHQHYFSGATDMLALNAGDKIFAYVYLDPSNTPSEIMFQWNDGSWNHRAYWGANNINWGVDGGIERHYMGPLPAAGEWVRLEVGAVQVGLEGRTLNGMAFTLYDGRATWDQVGKAAQTPVNNSWVDDRLPAGASTDGNEPWNWMTGNPTPSSGTYAQQSNIASGFHQHYFSGATETLTINTGEVLIAYVYLDPSNTPSEIMLQWNDGSWEHRAYWGADSIETSSSRINMGPLPVAGQWTRLEVPASQLGLEGSTLNGIAFKLYGGRAFWDQAGKSVIQPTNNPPTVSITLPANQATIQLPAYITINAAASDSDGTVTKVEFFQGTTKLGEDTTAPYSFYWENVGIGSYSLTAEATDNLGAKTVSSPVNITVTSIPVPPEGAPCPDEPSTAIYQGRLAEGASIPIPINLTPCETVSVIVTTTPTAASLTFTFNNNVGEIVLTDNWTALEAGQVEYIPYYKAPWIPPYRGTRGPAGLPMYGIFKATVSYVDYEIKVTKTPRPGYNIGGTGFTNARVVNSMPVSYYGSLWPSEQGQYFRIHLEGNQTLYLSGYALGHDFYSSNFSIAVYNSSQEWITYVVNLTAGGRVEFSDNTYTNPSPNPADFYLRVTTSAHPTHDFELNIQTDHCSVSPETKPVAPDATGDGPSATTWSEYKFPAAVDPDVLPRDLDLVPDTPDLISGRETELWARVYRPTNLSGGPYPLIIFLHGNHLTCGDFTTNPRVDDSDWYTYIGTCPEDNPATPENEKREVVPNHLGYQYLAVKLASQGYIVVSINANRGITAADDALAPVDDPSYILARGRLVLKHLQKLSEWHVNGGTPTELGVDLTGKIDFSNVGLMGHSRGGQGVRAAYNLYHDSNFWPNRILRPVTFRAIFEVAPTDARATRTVGTQTFDTLEARGTKWNVLLPMCDGDLTHLPGVKPFDRMMLSATDNPATQKSTYTVWGSNHNFYNTEWQLNDARRRTGCIGGGNVPLFTSSSDGSPLQRQIGLASIIAFFRANVGAAANESLNQNFNPRYKLPPVVTSVTRVDRGFTLSPATIATKPFEDFNDPAVTNYCTSSHTQCSDDVTVVKGVVPNHDESLMAGLLAWTSGGTDRFFQANWKPVAQEQSINVSGFQTLDFRVSRQLNENLNPSVPTTFSVQLVMENGSVSGGLSLCKYYGNLRGPVGGYEIDGGIWRESYHPILETVRIPLTDFAGADLTKVRGIRFVFNGTPTGSIYLTNIRFAN